MRILQVSAYFYPSYRGTETTVAELTRELTGMGHMVDVLTVNTEGAARQERWLGLANVYRCAPVMRYRRGVFSLEIGLRLLNAKAYDIYHVHIPFHSGLEMAVIASIINGVPLVATHHGESPKFSLVHGLVDGMYRKLYRGISLRRARRVVFFTRSYPQSLELGPALRRKSIAIPPAVDTARFSPDNDGMVIRRKLGIDPAAPVVLCVSGLMPGDERRGIHFLIKAMAQVRGEVAGARLVVVGEGELVPGLKLLAYGLGLTDGVIFAGRVLGAELAQYYAMCDIFAFPTTYEPFGFVVLEALASGKPAVVSDIPGVGELVVQGETGLKVQPRNPGALAEALISLIRDPGLRRRMGAKGRELSVRRSWRAVAQDMARVYEQVAAGSHGHGAGQGQQAAPLEFSIEPDARLNDNSIFPKES